MAKCSNCGRLLGDSGMPAPDGTGAYLCNRCFRMELAINVMDNAEKDIHSPIIPKKFDVEGRPILDRPDRKQRVKKTLHNI